MAISADCAVRAARCAAVGTAAGPWVASAARGAELTGTGETCCPSADRDDCPAPAVGWPADGWLLAPALPAVPAGTPELAVETGELQPAVSVTAVAAAAPPIVSQSR